MIETRADGVEQDTANGWWTVQKREPSYIDDPKDGRIAVSSNLPLLFIYRKRLPSTGRWAVVVKFLGRSVLGDATICQTEEEAIEFIDALLEAA